MSWTDRLVNASFRDIEFLTESHDARGGQRLVVHEFPGRDDPETEDLGTKAWDYRLNAYFLGADYDLARNAFLKALGEHGATWLNHPWLGMLWVRSRDWSVHESNDKGGYCSIAIEFVPGGGTVTATTDRVDVATNRLGALTAAAQDDFQLAAMSAGATTAFLSTVSSRLAAMRQAISLAALPLSTAGQMRTLLAGMMDDIGVLMGNPASYATAFGGMAGTIGDLSADDVVDTDRPRLASSVVRAAGIGSAVAPTGVAATDGAVLRNLSREDALRQRLLVVSAAQIALADYRAEADRDTALTVAVNALDGLLPGAPDTVFEAAVAARAALIEALQAQDLRPALQRDVAGELPAVVLAHRLDVDEDVFIARNAVRHPLFVSGKIYG